MPQKLIKYIKENFENVSKLSKQLTETEAQRLLEQFQKPDIVRQLQNMENYKLLTKNNSSVYLTMLKWFESDRRKGYIFSRPQKNDVVVTENAETIKQNIRDITDKSAKVIFLSKNPIGTNLKDKQGFDWEVIDKEFLRNKKSGDLMPVLQFINYNKGVL